MICRTLRPSSRASSDSSPGIWPTWMLRSIGTKSSLCPRKRYCSNKMLCYLILFGWVQLMMKNGYALRSFATKIFQLDKTTTSASETTWVNWSYSSLMVASVHRWAAKDPRAQSPFAMIWLFLILPSSNSRYLSIALFFYFFLSEKCTT